MNQLEIWSRTIVSLFVSKVWNKFERTHLKTSLAHQLLLLILCGIRMRQVCHKPGSKLVCGLLGKIAAALALFTVTGQTNVAQIRVSRVIGEWATVGSSRKRGAIVRAVNRACRHGMNVACTTLAIVKAR